MHGEEGPRAAADAAKASLADADDAALLSASAEGDGRAFSRLVARHYDIVYRVTWRTTSGHADTEDIVQDAFVKLWSNPLQVREAAALRTSSFGLPSISPSTAAGGGRGSISNSIAEPRSEAADALEQAVAAGSAKEVDRAIAGLPERQRLALALVHFEGQSNIDAAATMEISVEAVESLLARARRTLKDRLKDRWREILEDLE